MKLDNDQINYALYVAELAVEKYATIHGDIKPFLSLKEAQTKYGTATLNRWIKEGLISKIKDGNASSKVRLDRVRLEAISKASNRSSYLNTQERKDK